VSLLGLLKRTPITRAVFRHMNRYVYEKLEKIDGLFQIQVEERLECLLNRPKYEDPLKLSRYEYEVFSQSGEDGIIAEIFRRVGVTNKTFVEFGVEDGVQNNTRYLLTAGWTGTWIEASKEHLVAIRERYAEKIKQGTLRLCHAFVTAENIESLFEKSGVPQEIDLLSIDIDGNDYWVWERIERYHPRVVVIEYNAVFPPGCQWIREYVPNASWDGTRNFGASLTALEFLGARKGYKLVGCNLAGVNAFFVREDLVREQFCSPFTAGNHYEPPRYYLGLRTIGRAPM